MTQTKITETTTSALGWLKLQMGIINKLLSLKKKGPGRHKKKRRLPLLS